MVTPQSNSSQVLERDASELTGTYIYNCEFLSEREGG
jgi:hypothetical protein